MVALVCPSQPERGGNEKDIRGGGRDCCGPDIASHSPRPECATDPCLTGREAKKGLAVDLEGSVDSGEHPLVR